MDNGEENTSNFADILLNINNTCQEQRDHALNTIESIISSNPMEFIYKSSLLIISDDVPQQDKIVKSALTLISSVLTPLRSIPLEVIRNAYFNPIYQEARPIIQQAVFRGILFEDESTIAIAAHTIALLFNVEQDCWSQLIPSLLSVALSPEYQLLAHLGAILAINEIYSNGIQEEIFLYWVSDIISLTKQILLTVGQHELRMVQESAKLLSIIINKYQINPEEITCLINLVESLILTEDFVLFRSLYKILKNIFLKFYLVLDEQTVEHIIQINLASLKHGILEQQMLVISFWRKLAAFESQAVNNKEVFLKYGPTFIDPIFTVITSATTESFEEEGCCMTDIQKAGSLCLEAQYTVANTLVMDMVSKFFIDAQNSNNWIAQQSSLVALRSVIKKHDSGPAVAFILEQMPVILEYASSENDIISACAFQTINRGIKRRGLFTQVSEFQTLYSIIGQNLGRSPIVIKYIIKIYIRFCLSCRKDDNFSLIAEHYSFICAHIFQLIERPDSRETDIMLMAYSLLSFLISKTPPPLFMVFEQFLNHVKETLYVCFDDNGIDETLLFNIQVSMCDIISAMGNRNIVANKKDPKVNFMLPHVNEIIKILLTLINQKRTQILDEAIYAINSLIPTSQSVIQIEEVIQLQNIITEAFTSGGESEITSVAIMLGDLFQIQTEYMSQFQDLTFEMIHDKIFDQSISNNCAVKLLGWLAQIAANLGDFTSTENREKLLFYSNDLLLNTSLDHESEDFKKLFFEEVLYAYKIVLTLAGPDDTFLSQHFNDFMKLINTYFKAKAFSKFSISICCDFMSIMVDNYGIRATKPLYRLKGQLNSLRDQNIHKEKINEIINKIMKYK